MQICKTHWDKLREAIATRGLDHLGAKSGEEAISDAVATLEGEDTAFDPLMSCNWMIHNRALEIGGLYLISLKQDGTHYCPICEAIEHADDMTVQELETYWINGPADSVLETAREMGLVARQQ